MREVVTTSTKREDVEALARKFCAHESEIWDEAPASYRERWRREARAALGIHQ